MQEVCILRVHFGGSRKVISPQERIVRFALLWMHACVWGGAFVFVCVRARTRVCASVRRKHVCVCVCASRDLYMKHTPYPTILSANSFASAKLGCITGRRTHACHMRRRIHAVVSAKRFALAMWGCITKVEDCQSRARKGCQSRAFFRAQKKI